MPDCGRRCPIRSSARNVLIRRGSTTLLLVYVTLFPADSDARATGQVARSDPLALLGGLLQVIIGALLWIWVPHLIGVVIRAAFSAPKTPDRARRAHVSPEPSPDRRTPSPVAPEPDRALAKPPSQIDYAHDDGFITHMTTASVQGDDEQRRRRARVHFIIQQAVEATADTYRDGLQVILEHQDGPEWLDAFNDRRQTSMAESRKRAPALPLLRATPFLNCLARDPAGLQVIPATAAAKVKQLSGLAVAAHHPDPDAPLSEADGYRAWQLYTDVANPRALSFMTLTEEAQTKPSTPAAPSPP